MVLELKFLGNSSKEFFSANLPEGKHSFILNIEPLNAQQYTFAHYFSNILYDLKLFYVKSSMSCKGS